MKRAITLYIGSPEQRADLDDQSFILFNWATTDVTEIAQVKNGHSCTVSLPGTPTNDGIFGQMQRNDRKTIFDVPTNGIYFDASRRTPFTIYDDSGGILETGYLKLDEVTTTGALHSYKVTLYGGIGSFLYALAYDSNGDKRTLADLKYHKHLSVVQEDLSFTISAATVKAAWDRLAVMNVYGWPSDKWEIINFAPAYNGYPRGAFNADKGVYPGGGFLPNSVDGYTAPGPGGEVLVTMPTKKTEWETRDLRSYLQRPVLRVAALVDAICYPGNNGGFTVDLSDAFLSPSDDTTQGSWITLPLLQDLNLDTQVYNATINITQGAPVSLPVSPVPSMRTKYRVNVVPRLYITGATNLMLFSTSFDDPGTFYCNVIRVSCQLWKAGVLQETRYLNAATANVGTETGTYNWTITHNGYLRGSTGQGNWVGDEIVFEFDDSEADEIVVNMNYVATADGSGSPISGAVWNGSTLADRLNATSTGGGIYGSATGDLTTSSRSYAIVTQAKLLSTDYTPADYLLSLCKRTNHRLQFDPVTGVVKIIHIDQYWQGMAKDITKRINRSKPITKTPLQFSARWYEWREKYDHGEWAKYYETVYGRTYGAQRVNTGWDFDANTLEVVDTVLFRGAVQILESSQYFVDVFSGGALIPSVFVEGGATYGLVNQEGKVENVPVPSTEYVARSYLNGSYPQFDLFDKAQFHDADNAAYDERDTLLYFGGTLEDVTGKGYILTDDTKEMMALNNNTPCWHLSLPTGGYALTAIPHFSRMDGDRLLDWGIPAEIPVPGINYSDLYGEYEMNWQSYIWRHFTVDNPVVRCYVNWEGMQVGPQLLRGIYEFDGARWHLNKIINYSLTTWDDTECEFIKYE